MLANKQNDFDDFYAAAQELVQEHWTDTAHLGILGGSNGGPPDGGRSHAAPG